MGKPCQGHAERPQLGLVLGLASGWASECMHTAQGGWMWDEQAMPGPCTQAAARPALGGTQRRHMQITEPRSALSKHGFCF